MPSTGAATLQPRRRVHDVAGRHPLSFDRAGAHDHKGLACVHCGADVEVEPLVLDVQGSDSVANRERRANRALGVVLVRHGCTEESDDGVPDEFLDGPAEALELRPQARVVRGEHRPDVLGVERLGARGRADDVREERRHDLPFLVRGLGGDERRSAGQAEPRDLGVGRTALLADRHVPSLPQSQSG